MSYNVLVVPEDATNDHYILKPICAALLTAIGKPQAKLRVLTDPAVRGVNQALNDIFLASVFARYPMVDLFLLCVDRDAEPGRDASVVDRQRKADALLTPPRRFLGTTAHQEVEVWCLAGMVDLPKSWGWQDIRAARDPKETYYRPYAASRNLLDAPGDGREALGREAAKRYASVRVRCAEIADLEARIAAL